MTSPVTFPGTCKLHENVAEAVRRAINQRHLLHNVARLGLAVSGGADSVALFHLLLPLCRQAGVTVTVLHFNHGLRTDGEEDARFVKELADSSGVPFLSEAANLAARVSAGDSLEMAARAARMAFFSRCCTGLGLDAVATGHQADDVAETMLLRLARGAGATGLSGLRPVSRLSASLVLIRPLLSISALALRGWLIQHNHAWREDRTNRDGAIPRNFVRNSLLPQLERTWLPDLKERLCQSAEALREDDVLLEALARQAQATVCPDDTLWVARLRQQPIACTCGVGCYPAACTLGEASLEGQSLRVRSRLPGDRISPIGLRGSKKLQDLFVDEKVPEHLRDQIPVFTCGDEVVWVPGYRVARTFAVPSADAPSIQITVRQSERPD